MYDSHVAERDQTTKYINRREMFVEVGLAIEPIFRSSRLIRKNIHIHKIHKLCKGAALSIRLNDNRDVRVENLASREN